MAEELALFSLGSIDAPGSENNVADLQTAEGLLALMALPSVGNARAIKFAQKFRSADAFNDASPETRRHVGGVAIEDHVHLTHLGVPGGAIAVGFFDDAYPSAVREIPNPPAVIWVRGSLPDPARRIAVVGTRSATPWGAQLARSIGEDAAEAGVSVVSGLAFGVDIAAHRGALAAGGHTVAVLGSGIDVPSPREHANEVEEILESGGCLIAEVPPGTPPNPRTLVSRNRIQSGLSYATIVVQCGLKSGTLSTAKFALDQKRVLALPVPPEAERVHPENAGSESMLSASPAPVVLATRDDLASLLALIS